MEQGLRKKRERLVVNLKLLAVKAYGSVICRMPCKRLLNGAAGIVMGVLSMFLHTGQWKAIAQFARSIGSRHGRLLFIVNYFIQKEKDLAWELSGYEAPLDPAAYTTITGKEPLEQAVVAGRGAILLGAHYGPSLYLHTLHALTVNVKVLVDPWRLEYWDHFEDLGAARLRRKMFFFLKSVSLAAGKQEKALISHLRAGGAVFMDIDNPGPRTEDRTVPFLGADIPPHYFPFELSMKYQAPVFFCLFEKDSQRPYRFSIVPCGPFSSAEEGFRKYAGFVEKRILSCPFMWSFVPHFSVMFTKKIQRPSGSTARTTNP